MPKNHQLFKKLIPLLIGIVLIFTIATAAIANSPAPPERHWLKLSYVNGAFPNRQQPILEGLQILQCESAQCQQPSLIMHYKTCNKTGCVPGAPLIQYTPTDGSGPWLPHFSCVDNTCFWSIGGYTSFDLHKSHNFNRNLLKIVAQYPDRVRSSHVFKLSQPEGFDPPTNIEIAVQANDLRISQNPNKKSYSASEDEKANRANLATTALLSLSVGSEVVIAYFYLRRQQPPQQDLRRFLLSVLLVHLFSIPIVWFSFSALTAFSSFGNRTAGIAWILMSLLYGAIVTAYYSIGKQPKKTSTWVSGTIWFWILGVMILFGCALLDYGVALPLSTDLFLPDAWSLPTSEIFVWLYEAWIIYAVSKHLINYRNAILLSFVTNLTSFSLGSIAIALTQYLSK